MPPSVSSEVGIVGGCGLLLRRELIVLLLQVCIGIRLLQIQQLKFLATEQIELLMAVQACRADDAVLAMVLWWMLATVQCSHIRTHMRTDTHTRLHTQT